MSFPAVDGTNNVYYIQFRVLLDKKKIIIVHEWVGQKTVFKNVATHECMSRLSCLTLSVFNH